ncbi:MAG TPA: GAF domain-containing sensor histidine kinase [Pilimelia sp.]|nr:GAF domain-containing sensor histidine kinase [Pilimelia sp.]
MLPPIPADEADRVRALRELDVLDTPPDEEFDQIVALASRICGVPMSLVSLIDTDRQWFKARLGIDVAETSRDLSFCAYAILGRDLLVVPDARTDVRFADNPAVRGDPGIRFYAGAPLVTTGGFPLGTLCVVDAQPRRLTLEQLQALRALARQVTAQLELRHSAASLSRAQARTREAAQGIDDFVGLIRGELRGPLADVREYLDHLAAGGGLDPAVAARAAQAARDHAGSLCRLVDDLLCVAGGNTDSELRMRRVDLSQLVRRAVEAVRPIAHAKKIWILNQQGPDLPVLADPVRLEQALAHLLFAAVKYTPEGGRVKVSTDNEACPAVRLEDLETPESGRPHLFEHVYHGALAQRPDQAGPDHGLAVTKQILDVHHATLALSDRPGDGTSLHVVFPGYASARG